MLRTSGIILILCSLSMSVFSTPRTDTVETRRDGIRLVLSLPKCTYNIGEPVVATVTVINELDVSRRLVEPDYDAVTITWDVVNLDPKAPFKPPISTSVEVNPAFFWDFSPGEARRTDVYCNLPTTTGDYVIVVTYHSYSSIDSDWHGELDTPRLPFTVVDTPNIDENPFRYTEALTEAGRSPAYAKKLAEIYRKLKNPDNGKAFARYAGYWEAQAYRVAGNKPAYLESLKQYVEEHPDVPYYTGSAHRKIAGELFDLGKYQEALSQLDNLPDGAYKRHWIKRCKEKVTER